MSTGADAKSMPITLEYAEGHERIFGERKELAPTRRRVYVSRCSSCDGVTHEPDTRLWPCERCGKETRGLVDINAAPPPPVAEALNAPVMAGRFYENTFAPDLDKTDIGSRKKHREYMAQRGLTNPSDFKETWAKAEAERAKIRAGEPIYDSERREQIGRIAYAVEKRSRRK